MNFFGTKFESEKPRRLSRLTSFSKTCAVRWFSDNTISYAEYAILNVCVAGNDQRNSYNINKRVKGIRIRKRARLGVILSFFFFFFFVDEAAYNTLEAEIVSSRKYIPLPYFNEI